VSSFLNQDLEGEKNECKLQMSMNKIFTRPYFVDSMKEVFTLPIPSKANLAPSNVE
jgi:hypothetical protein